MSTDRSRRFTTS
nr:expressed peptide start [Expression vector pZH3]